MKETWKMIALLAVAIGGAAGLCLYSRASG